MSKIRKYIAFFTYLGVVWGTYSIFELMPRISVSMALALVFTMIAVALTIIAWALEF